MITLEQLIAVFNRTPRAKLAELHPHLVSAMAEFGIDTRDEVCMFLAQCGEESGGLSMLSENLNYSTEGLLRVFKRYFTPEQAAQYARQPERIANRVYANRMGNGPEESGDGWARRGAGLIQLTGTDNHYRAADALGVPRDQISDYLRTPEGACRSAGWYWKSRSLDDWAAKGDFDGVSDLVNRGRKTQAHGDAIGFEGREHYLQRLQSVMGGA